MQCVICGKKGYARDLCTAHYQQARQGAIPFPRDSSQLLPTYNWEGFLLEWKSEAKALVNFVSTGENPPKWLGL